MRTFYKKWQFWVVLGLAAVVFKATVWFCQWIGLVLAG